MERFIFTMSDFDYHQLRKLQDDYKRQNFYNCNLPPGCLSSGAYIGFQKDCDDTYILYIDQGILCSNADSPWLFRQWLKLGKLNFLDFNDVITFLRGLKVMYPGG